MKKQKYSKVFKERTLQLCAERGSVSEVCKELGLRSNMVYRWRREQEEYGTRSFPGQGHDKLTTTEAKIKALEKALAEREEELDILKKAISVLNKLKR